MALLDFLRLRAWLQVLLSQAPFRLLAEYLCMLRGRNGTQAPAEPGQGDCALLGMLLARWLED